jgi:hypothetical protein
MKLRKENWIVTEGFCDVSDDKIVYKPHQKNNKDGAKEQGSTIVSSNIDFESGEISFNVTFKSNAEREACRIGLNHDTELPYIMAGFNPHPSPFLFGIQRYSNQQWEFLNGAGEPKTLEVDKPYFVQIKALGSTLELFVGKVKVAVATVMLKKSQIRLFLRGSSEIIIENVQVNTKEPKAFVVMQFSDEYNQLYNEVIAPITQEFGVRSERADDYFTTQPIIQDIINSIKESSVVIAEITPDNPNVFYEVGYAHALGKPTILLCDKTRPKLPFDVSSFRTLFYDNSIAGKSKVERNLRRYLQEIF